MVKIGSAVHTAHGLGRVTEYDTVRGRTQYKVAGDGFSVWLDETRVLTAGDNFDAEPASSVNEDNSTTLPYDPTPQHPVEMFDGEQDFAPEHSIDADERTSPSDSLDFDRRSLDTPGPSRDLFATRLEDLIDSDDDDDGEKEKDEDSRLDPRLRELLGPPYEEDHRTAAEKVLPWTNEDWEHVEQHRHPEDDYADHPDSWSHEPTEQDYADWEARHKKGSVMRTARPGSFQHYLDWADEAGMQPDQDATADLYGQTHGVDGYSLLNKYQTQRTKTSHRPAGLSDKYIDIQAAVDPTDPVTQFRNDPVTVIQRTAYLAESAGLDPRIGQYMDLVESDAMIREAAWNDVRKKAMRLRREGKVHVKDVAPDRIYATVEGDNGTYDVMIAKGSMGGFGGGHDISHWRCGCEWGKWAFKRTRTFIGRLCSHGYASYMEMQSAHFTDQPRQQRLPRPPKRRKSSGLLDKFKSWVSEQNWEHVDIGAADDFIGQQDDDPTPAEVHELYEYVHSNPAVSPVREYDVKGYTHDPDKVYKSARGKSHSEDDDYDEDEVCGDPFDEGCRESLDDGEGYDGYCGNCADRLEEMHHWGSRTAEDHGVLRTQPQRLTPDFLQVPQFEQQEWMDVESDERKTTGPDQIMARRAKVEKNWAKKHSEMDDEKHPIVHFSSRRQALTYTADENLLDRLRDLSAEPASESNGNKAERNAEVAAVVDELHDRGYDASQFVASIRRMAVGENAPWAPLAPSDDEPAAASAAPSSPWTSETLNTFSPETKRNMLRDTFKPPSTFDEDAPLNNGINYTQFSPETQKGMLSDAFGGGSRQQQVAPAAQASPTGPAASPTNSGGNAGGGNAGGDAAGGGWVSPPGGTKGPVGDGGRPGAENGNNAAITGDSYVVQQGDTLTDIAQRGFGDMNRYEDLAKANNITNADQLSVGQEIKSGDGGPFTGNNGVSGDVTNPAGSTSVQAGPAFNPPAAAEAPAPAPASDATPPQGDPGNGANPTFQPPVPPPAAGGTPTASRWFFADDGHNHGGEEDNESNKSKSPTDGSTAAPGPGTAPTSPTTPQSSSSGTGKSSLGVPDPGNKPQMQDANNFGSGKSQTGTPVNTSDPLPGQSRPEERAPAPGQSTPTGSGFDASMLSEIVPVVTGIGSAIAPMMDSLAPGLGGAAGAIGNGISSLLSGFSLASRQAAVDDPSGPTDVEPDPSFAGTGPYPKQWWSTSEDYVEEHEKEHWEDVTDGAGDITNYTPPKQQPKQANRDSDWTPEMIEDWVSRHDPNHKRPKEEIHFVHDDEGHDIVAAFQRNAANSALAAPAGSGGSYSDAAIAEAAQGFLRTAGRVYSLAEQQELMDESHPQGARNLKGLDLKGTHYVGD